MLGKFREKFLLETVVFFSGAVVMIYEIIGSRILAPYIGTSTYIWTSLIGVILGSLSVGYWLGGSVADRQSDSKLLAAVLFAAAALVTVTMLVQEFVLLGLAASSMRLELKALIAALVLFAPASVLFGFVTPYAVRLKMTAVEDAGKTVGRLYALSTVGSICGTFAAGFFLLPFVGSVRTLYLIVIILFLLSLLVVSFKITVKNLFVVASKSDKISFESDDEEIAAILANRYEKPLDLTVPALTDDLAPVEYYNSFVQKSANVGRNRLKNKLNVVIKQVFGESEK